MDEGGETEQLPISSKHVKKKSLKNKSLSVSFNEKDLKDYVTGFHKRKKKRRKEAEKQHEEVKRRKRIEDRKKRRLERQFAMYGPPAETDAATEDIDECDEEDEQEDPIASVAGTATYDSGEMQITVTTSEISREEEVIVSERPPIKNPELSGAEKKQKIPVTKKKPFKKPSRTRPKKKLQTKREKIKAKRKNSRG